MTDDQTNPSRRARRRRRPGAAAIAGGTALALGLGAGGYALAGAAMTAGSGVATAATMTAATSPATPKTRPAWPDGPDGPGGPGGPGAGRLGRHVHGGLAGTVTAVGSGSITLATPDGASVTVHVDASTTYRQGEKTLTLGQLTAGENVVVAPTAATAHAASPVASSVAVVGPVLAGRVVRTSSSGIVVADAQGFYRTIVASSATTVTKAGAASSLSAITVGSRIEAIGTIAADHTDLDATAIRVVVPHIAGRVASVDPSAGTITLSMPGSTTTTVTTTSATRFLKGASTTTLGAIPSGAFVVVAGSPGTGSTFAALEVTVAPAHGPMRAPGHRGVGTGAMPPWGGPGPGGFAR